MSSSESDPTSQAPANMQHSQHVHLSPTKSTAPRTPMKSPLRRVRAGLITKEQKQAMIDNLKLEISERVRRLRAQYTAQARALRQRIEMRINRVPKKLWDVKMGELLEQSTMPKSTSALTSRLHPGGARGFVEEIIKLSRGDQTQRDKTPPLIVPKHRVTNKSPVRAARDQMPPPPIPTGPAFTLVPKNNLPPASSPQRPAFNLQPLSPVKSAKKLPPSHSKKNVPPSSSASTRPNSRTTARTSMETAAASAESNHEEGGTANTKSSQAKRKGAVNARTKRGGKGAVSSASSKENKVVGAKEKANTGAKVTKNSTGGRVLRSRK
ncbi:hypothetical protein RUND412_001948 [Rhizina undulata]